MIKELILANITLLVLILAVIILKRKSHSEVSPQLAELKKVFGEDVEIHKIPKMEDDEELKHDSEFISSATSKKYHRAECVSARNIKKKISKTEKEFKKEGKTPCSACIK